VSRPRPRLTIRKPGRESDVIRLKRPGGHIADRQSVVWLLRVFIALVLLYIYIMNGNVVVKARYRPTKNCVAYGCNNVANVAAKDAGITFHS